MSEVRWKMYVWHKTSAILSATYIPKMIKIDENLTKFWQKQFVQFVLRHGVYKTYQAIAGIDFQLVQSM